MEPKASIPGVLRNERSEDYASVYANNVTLEPSVWDLKLTFGELDQGVGTISQHTAVTIPWTVAKLFYFLLKTQIVAHEMQNGKIRIPNDLMPPEFPVPAENIKDNPVVQRTYERLIKLREEFLEEAKEA